MGDIFFLEILSYIPYTLYSPVSTLVCDDGTSLCAMALTMCSMLMIMVTLPLSLLLTIKVVQVWFKRLYYKSEEDQIF